VLIGRHRNLSVAADPLHMLQHACRRMMRDEGQDLDATQEARADGMATAARWVG